MPNDPETPTVIQLTDGIWCRQEIDNMGWADMGGYTLVVDALEQPSASDDVLIALDETCGDQPVQTVVNTHTHPDHVALNPVFARMGAEILNLRTTEIPAEGRRLNGTSREARVLPFPGTHTDEDCVVWFPDDDVLFVGDLFGWGLLPPNTNLREGLMERVIEVYDRLIAFDAKHVVPGHGPLCSVIELRRCREYFIWLIGQARSLMAKGGSARDAASIPPPTDLAEWWRFRQWKHQDTAKKIAKAVDKGWI